jgi:hypothetical protein
VKKELIAWNRGRISPLALARTDFTRTALSSEIQTNWMPRTLGSMMLRPGLEYTGATKGNALSVSLPFIYATDDTARCELTDGIMRVWVDDVLVTRPAVTSAVTNGSFTSDVTGWTDVDGGTAVSAWATGGYLSLVGSGNAFAKRRQEVTTVETGTRHSLDIEIERGPVLLRVGSTAGDDDYIRETTLYAGSHSLSFTPTGNFWIDLFNYEEAASLVSSINVAASGVMELTAPWAEADLRLIRWDQSGDVIFAACTGYRQRRIERRAVDSWSIVEYLTDDGPFRVQNVGPVTLTPTATSGDTVLTASASLFRSTHVGALFKLEQTGQLQTADITASDQYSDPIRVTGVDGTRAFAVIITGTWVGTINLQYSVSAPGDWIDATSGTFTGNTAISYDDTLDNQVIYYRIGAKSGAFTSGTASVSLSSSSGSQQGIARITGYTNATTVDVAVLSEFGSAGATSTWFEGDWSDRRGWPSSVAFYEGRLWWSGSDKIKGSLSDGFSSYDDTLTGDSAPIQRSIGSGPVATINWMLPLQRLLLGADGSVWSARSSSFDEPLTPTNFNLKDITTQGSSSVAAVKKDTSAIFTQRSGIRVYEAQYDGGAYDYAVTELTTHIPEIGEPGIVRMAIQTQPETRVHHIRSDGTVAILVYNKDQEVICWVDFETDGEVEDVVVLPGSVEDQVYYQIKRTIDGSTVRYFEKWAMESECQGSTLNKQADAFLSASGSGASITGLGHLEGETVVCWADGVDKGTFTVASGAIAQAYTTGYVVGLPYTATYKSTKLVYSSPDGSSGLCEKKRITQLGVVAQNMHPLSLEYGPDFTDMNNMPTTEKYDVVDTDTIWAQYDEEMFSFVGEWNTDSRLCLRATAPLPVTLLAGIVQMEVNRK